MHSVSCFRALSRVTSLVGLGLAFVALPASSTASSAEVPYYFGPLAGTRGRSGIQDGVGAAARFGYLGGNNTFMGIAVDASGVAYFADSWNNTIRRIAPSGAVTTLAGTPRHSGFVDGSGVEAMFNRPAGLALDLDGNLLVADSGNSVIRKVTPKGVVTTPSWGTGGAVPFRTLMDLAIDAQGNIYVSDTGNNSVRRIGLSGVTTTLAGGMDYYATGDEDGEGQFARFRSPHGIEVDAEGSVYVVDTGNNTIRKISTTNLVTTLAGNPGSYRGHADGLGVNAKFWIPLDLCFDPSGALLVADAGNSVLRRVTLDGYVTTVAGQPNAAETVDGVGPDAHFYAPIAIAMGGDQRLYVVDSDFYSVILRQGIPAVPNPPSVLLPPTSQTIVAGERTMFRVIAEGYPLPLSYQWQRAPVGTSFWENLSDGPPFSGATQTTLVLESVPLSLAGSRIRCVVGNGVGTAATSTPATLRVLPLASEYAFTRPPHYTGIPQTGSDADGPGPLARFSSANGLALDRDGNLIIADTNNYTIRRMARDTLVTTLAGQAHKAGAVNGTGSDARFGFEDSFEKDGPRGVALDADNNVIVADPGSVHNPGNNRVRKVSPAGVVSTIATGNFRPEAVAVDPSGNILFTDSDRHVIHQIDSTGAVKVWAGSIAQPGANDGPRLAARFNFPTGLTFDADGNLYVADTGNHTIRVITSTGNVATVAGIAGTWGTQNAHRLNATFYGPTSVAIESDGVIFVADTGNHAIRRIGSDDMVTTWVGRPGTSGRLDGKKGFARLNLPTALVIDQEANLYVLDSNGATVRRVSPQGTITTIAGNAGGQYGGLYEVAQLSTDAAGNLYGVGRFFPGNTVSGWKMRPDFQITFLTDPGPGVFEFVQAVTASRDGTVYIGATNSIQRLRRIAPDGIVYPIDTSPPQSVLDPRRMAVDEDQNLYVLDSPVGAPVRVSAEGSVQYLNGNYASPRGLTTDATGNVFFADTNNHAIRRLSPGGTPATVAGSLGAPGNADGTGTAAQFNLPQGVAVSRGGTIFVADTGNHTIRRITADGAVTTIGGTVNSPGTTDGKGPTARFNSPSSVAADDQGRLFVADSGNHALRVGTPVLPNPTAPVILSQPAHSSTTAGSTATMAIVAESAWTVDYAWQRSAPGGEWSDLLDDPTFAGTASVELSINDVNLTLDGTQFRCVTHNGFGPGSVSAPATLQVSPLAGTISLADLVHVFDGTPKSVTATAAPVGLAIELTYDGSPDAPSSAGSYAVIATIRHTHYAGSASATLQIQPVLTLGQSGMVVTTAGGATMLSVAVTGSTNATYQWQFEQAAAIAADFRALATLWVDLPGATESSYTLASTQRFHAGRYRVVVTANGAVATSEPVVVAVDPPAPSPGRLLNLSTRAQTLTGSDILIPGFVVSGTATKRLLIRAVGPTLALPQYGVSGTLDNPRLALKQLDFSTTPPSYVDIAANDDWHTNANAAAITQTAASLFAFPFADDREAALLVDLAPGQYTVFVDGVNDATGIAIVELYDADAANVDARLINLSNRGFAGVGEQVLIPGFVISAEGPKTLLVRVVGPRLAGFGVAGTMADPQLTVYSGQTPILSNDNWSDNPDATFTANTAQAVGAFALTNGSADAAFVVTLPPGVYTVIGSSATAGGTGVVLVEVYIVP